MPHADSMSLQNRIAQLKRRASAQIESLQASSLAVVPVPRPLRANVQTAVPTSHANKAFVPADPDNFELNAMGISQLNLYVIDQQPPNPPLTYIFIKTEWVPNAFGGVPTSGYPFGPITLLNGQTLGGVGPCGPVDSTVIPPWPGGPGCSLTDCHTKCTYADARACTLMCGNCVAWGSNTLMRTFVPDHKTPSFASPHARHIIAYNKEDKTANGLTEGTFMGEPADQVPSEHVGGVVFSMVSDSDPPAQTAPPGDQYWKRYYIDMFTVQPDDYPWIQVYQNDAFPDPGLDGVPTVKLPVATLKWNGGDPSHSAP